MTKKRDALIVTDIQNDFCPGGSLAVEEGDAIVPLINSIMESFFKVVGTQDWHPYDQISFASNHSGKKPFDVINYNGIEQTLWPDHCVQGTPGADFHPNLDTSKFDLIIRKGTNPAIDSYSTFLENDRKTRTGLDGYLKSLDITHIYLCGLATDVCVYYSALDSLSFGFSTYVILDACRGIDVPENSIDRAIDDMKKKGVIILNSGEIDNG